MKSRLFVLLLLLPALLVSLSGAGAESQPDSPEAVYTAKSNLEFHLRPEPGSERWVGTVPVHQRVEVLSWAEDWSLLRYGGAVGYAETRWLREFIALDPQNHPLPGYQPCAGLWTFSRRTPVAAGEFGGLTVPEGTVAAVRERDGGWVLPVWRSEMELDPSSGHFAPFVPWAEAGAGDLLAAFTTFYNDSYGAPLAAERRQNIELGCSLLGGLTVDPGEDFSFNGICGPYNQKTGYVVARNVSSSGFGPGGGVCQLSTTLYNALLEIPVQLTDWAVHSVSGVKYIPVAFDACVGRYSDLCFRNTLPFSLRIEAMAQDGALTVLIRKGD